LLKRGGHEHIVNIMKHGAIIDSFYFIDMELCHLTLRDYISYQAGQLLPAFNISATTTAPVFVSNDCSWLLRMQNVWTVALHIARGLKFLHSHNHVHRDLKPPNGTTILNIL